MSYGQNAPQGFEEETPLLSHTSNSKIGVYTIASAYATALFTGDPVKLLTGNAIGAATAGAAVCGVFKGVTFKDSNNETKYLPYWPATTVATEIEANVIDDPFVEFNIQAGTTNAGTHTATVNAADLHKNADFVLGAGNAANGLSSTYLDMATLATTATLTCKLLRLTPGFGTVIVGAPGTATNPQNAFGTLYNNVVVTFNNHVYKGGTGTQGV